MISSPKRLNVDIFVFCIIEELNIDPYYTQNPELVPITAGHQIATQSFSIMPSEKQKQLLTITHMHTHILMGHPSFYKSGCLGCLGLVEK